MEKTYWWRTLIFLLGGGMVFLGWIYDTYFCFATVEMNACPLDQIRLSILEPIILLSLSLLAVSPFLFFVRDEVFKKWLKFSVVWFIFALLLISATPVSIHSFSPLAGPEREMVSIWMASLFVIISLVKITWDSRKKV